MSLSNTNVVETQGLCKLYQPLASDIVCGPPLPQQRWKNHTTYPGAHLNNHYLATMLLKESASRGCKLCQFLMIYFGVHIPWQYQLGITRDCSHLFVNRCWGVGGKFDSVSGPDGSLGYLINIDIEIFERYAVEELSSADEIEWDLINDIHEEKPLRGLSKHTVNLPRLRRKASANPRDPISLALAARWLHDCVGKHQKCARHPFPLLPTRVIDVTTEGSDPWLHVTNGESGNYVALSYCWGKD
jgi:hypothetical protein